MWALIAGAWTGGGVLIFQLIRSYGHFLVLEIPFIL
jgi:hypothetical protein